MGRELTDVLAGALLLGVGFSLAYWAAVWWAVRQFFRPRAGACAPYSPRVSVLKPVKGVDADAYENFASFCRQDYPSYEVLFGAADPADPVVAVVRRLQADFPALNVGLVFVPTGVGNPKSASLDALARRAAGDVLVMSDADVWAAPDYLRRVTAPLADPRVGVVTCPYVSRPADGVPSLLEALHLNGEFLPSAIFAHEALGVPVGLGATIALRRADLARAGGYAAMADYLADDHEVVGRIARLGLRVEMSRCVVTHVLGAVGFREQWGQELRWAMAVRACSPWGYLGLFLTYTTPLAFLATAAMHFSVPSVALFVAAVCLRLTLAWRMQIRLCGRTAWRRLAWLPARECLSLLVWAAGLWGRRVAWKGRSFLVGADGRLEPGR